MTKVENAAEDRVTIHATENTKSATASYVLQPFTMSMTVPARTAYTMAFKISVVVDRGFKGSSAWFIELEDSRSDTKRLNTNDEDGTLWDGALVRSWGNTGNYRYFSADLLYITFYNTKGAKTQNVTKDFAFMVGAAKPNSVSDSCLHKMDATLTFTVDQANTKTVKSITYDANRGAVEDDQGQHTTDDSPVTLFNAPNYPRYTFKCWKALDGTTYSAGAVTKRKRVLSSQRLVHRRKRRQRFWDGHL